MKVIIYVLGDTNSDMYVNYATRILVMARIQLDTSWLTYAVIPARASISCQAMEQGLSLAAGFEHPASTLPTRFPAALGIGHDLPTA